VIDETATRIHSEEGRSVQKVTFHILVRDLPFGIITDRFSSASASGSTSEAANLLEAAEFGATTFLIDEDSSACEFFNKRPSSASSYWI
jgi:predicted ABC-class ATPase